MFVGAAAARTGRTYLLSLHAEIHSTAQNLLIAFRNLRIRREIAFRKKGGNALYIKVSYNRYDSAVLLSNLFVSRSSLFDEKTLTPQGREEQPRAAQNRGCATGELVASKSQPRRGTVRQRFTFNEDDLDRWLENDDAFDTTNEKHLLDAYVINGEDDDHLRQKYEHRRNFIGGFSKSAESERGKWNPKRWRRKECVTSNGLCIKIPIETENLVWRRLTHAQLPRMFCVVDEILCSPALFTTSQGNTVTVPRGMLTTLL